MAKKRGRGRPEGAAHIKPTDDQRQLVEVTAGLGMPQDEIARLIKSPTTGKGISPHTLRQHFREELDTGIAQVKAKIGINLLKLTEKSAAAAIFATKVRLQWKQPERDLSSKSTEKPQLTPDQIDKRIGQLLGKAEAAIAKASSNVISLSARKKSRAA